MKKAFDQTVRDIKREVNKKVLKVPGVEQKVLDATSNEPWGPHGSLLADIAQATRNYNEYQIIMAVIWKRINDTGKNWRHVYKALTVLEYLVAHGSDRVIDEIREHSYQISTLSDFQYIDSSGRDQGSNVRKKSQSLVVLVNDKERIQEVRQKAAANREKFRNTSVGGMHRLGSYSSTGGNGDRYDDDHYEGRYGSRDDDRNGHGREREYRDDDRYGRYGDSYGRDGERYSRDSDERYGRDGYRDDDDSRGRSRSIDDYQYGSRSRSADRERDRTFEDDGQYSARGSGARADDHSQDGSSSGRRLDRKFSEQNLGGPPSYEEAVSEARSPVQSERVGETPTASAPKTSVPPVTTSPKAIPAPDMSPAPAPANQQVNGFDEFDPRGSFSAAPITSNGDEIDILGSLSESFSSNPLAIMPSTSTTTTSEVNASANFSSAPTFAATPSASTVINQPFEDPFGDGPFKALPSTDGVPAPPQNITPTSSFHPTANQSSELSQPVHQMEDTVNLGDTFPSMAYTPSNNPNAQLSLTNAQFSPPELDILADILPPSGPSPPTALQTGFPVQANQPASMTGFPAQAGQPAPQTSFTAQTGQPQLHTSFSAQATQPTSQTGFVAQIGQPAPPTGFLAQPAPPTGFPGQISSASQTGFPAPSPQPAQPSANFYGNFLQQPGSTAPAAPHMASQTTAGPTTQYNTANFLPQTNPAVASQMAPQIPGGPAAQHNNDVLGNFLPQAQPITTMTSQPALTPSTGSLAIVPQPAKDKFEPKSSVWADTLNRGLVNFNISGPKTNPLADIGIDFEAINRKEKRMEKQPTTATVTSTVTMGKAMGSGSGVGRAGAGALRPSPNAMVGSGMNMGMGGGPGPGAGMGMGIGMGMGGGPGPGAGMGMGMGGGPGAGMGMGMGGGGGAAAAAGPGMGMGGYGGMNQGMGMGMGMGGGAGPGMGMGGYGGMNQPMGMGMGMNMPMNMSMGMNMGMGQGPQMQPTGFPPRSNMPGGYNPMMGRGNYGPQQPYGGGYR